MGGICAASYLDSLDLKLKSGILINHNHGVRMQLQTRQGPHVIDALLNAALQSRSFARPQDDDNNLTSLKHGLDTDSQGQSGNLTDVIVEETRVGQNSVMSQRLDSSSAGQARSGFIESNVAILANAGEEQIDTAHGLDGVFVRDALCVEVGSVSIQNMDVGRMHVDVREEMIPHERVV